MKKLLSVLGFLTLTSTPFISPLQVSTSTEIVTNKEFSNYQLIELEQQISSISAFAEYNQELYGMWNGYLTKMNLDGKFTNILGKENIIITSIKEFNGELYLVKYGVDTTIWKISANSEIVPVLTTSGILDSIEYLEVFNNELYFVYQSSSTDYKSLGKINAYGNVSEVLTFNYKVIVQEMKVFDNHLYFVTWDGSNSIFSKIDANGQIKKVQEINSWVEHLIVYNQELYFSLINGSLLKIDANNEIRTIIERSINPSHISTLVVFRNELYLANSNKLEKLTKDNKIETVVKLKANVQTLTVFNNELYIGMNGGYFAKLI